MSRRGPGSSPSRGFFHQAHPPRAAARCLSFGLPHAKRHFGGKPGTDDHGRAASSGRWRRHVLLLDTAMSAAVREIYALYAS